MGNRKKLSEDERRIRMAIIVALKADEILYAQELEREAEERRLAREKRQAEEEAIRRAEEEARRLAQEAAERAEAERLAAERAAAEEAAAAAAAEVRKALEEKIREIEIAMGKAVHVSRGQAAEEDERREFIYADSEDDGHSIVIPYTRRQYIDLPRKKKKSVLMTVRKMKSYQDLYEEVKKMRAQAKTNPNLEGRVAILEQKLAEEEKQLPKIALWEECVNRLKK